MFEVDFVKKISCPMCESEDVKFLEEDNGEIIIRKYKCNNCEHSQEEVI